MTDPAIQSSVSNYNGGGSVVGTTGNFGSPITAGNTIAVSVWTRSSGDVILSVTDTLLNSYGSPLQKVVLAGGNWCIYIFAVTGSAGGVNSITAHASVPVEIIVTATELPAASAVRVSNQNTGTSTTASVTLASTSTNDVVYAIASGSGGNWGSPQMGSNPGFLQAVLFGDVDSTFDGYSSGGTIAVQAVASSNPWAILAMAFTPPASAPSNNTLYFGSD